MDASNARPMKYPYTWSAKIAQFPLKHVCKTQWTFRYYLYSLILVSPVFMYITKLVNSPEYVAAHEERMKIMHEKDALEHAAKFPRSH